jgi:hypothetical protein
MISAVGFRFPLKSEHNQVLVTQAYNTSCLGGRDQEDFGLRLAQANHETLSEKFPTQKRAGGVAQVV